MLLQPPGKCGHYGQACRTHHSTEPIARNGCLVVDLSACRKYLAGHPMSRLAPIQEDLCAEEYPDRKDRKLISNASVWSLQPGGRADGYPVWQTGDRKAGPHPKEGAGAGRRHVKESSPGTDPFLLLLDRKQTSTLHRR